MPPTSLDVCFWARKFHRTFQELRISYAWLAASTGRDAVAAIFLEMTVEVVRAHKGFKTAGALVGPQACVHTHVILQVVVVGKGGTTLSTQVRLLSRMLAHVNL